METNPEQIAIAVGGLVGGGLLAWFLSRRQTTDETVRESVRTSYLDADRALMRIVNAAANMREAELRAKTAALQAQSGEEVALARAKLASTAKEAKEAVQGAKTVVAQEAASPATRTLVTKIDSLEQQLQEIQKGLATITSTQQRDARAAVRASTGGKKKKRKNEKKTKRAKKYHGV